MTASFSVSAGGLPLSGSAEVSTLSESVEGCMTNCRPTSGIVPVMVPLKGVPVVGACVSDAPTLYTHVPFRYARLMYQLLFRVPGRVARSSAPGGSACARAAVGRVAISVATLISKANIRLAGRWMSCNDVLMFYVYNRVYKSVVFSGRSGSPCPAGLAAVVLDAWQPLSGHAGQRCPQISSGLSLSPPPPSPTIRMMGKV